MPKEQKKKIQHNRGPPLRDNFEITLIELKKTNHLE